MKTPMEKLDANKYCDYHQDVGPHTNDYKALKDFIRKLIADGYLQEYIVHH